MFLQTPRRILFVDDDPDDQELFCKALSMMEPPQTCIIANNGEEAIAKALIPPSFDIIFLDLNMPVMNGYACLKKLKNTPELKDIPVIILSTSDNVYNIEDCKALGAVAYITKPSSLNGLFDELNNVFTNADFM